MQKRENTENFGKKSKTLSFRLNQPNKFKKKTTRTVIAKGNPRKNKLNQREQTLPHKSYKREKQKKKIKLWIIDWNITPKRMNLGANLVIIDHKKEDKHSHTVTNPPAMPETLWRWRRWTRCAVDEGESGGL